jgi:hypothetical protein
MMEAAKGFRRLKAWLSLGTSFVSPDFALCIAHTSISRPPICQACTAPPWPVCCVLCSRVQYGPGGMRYSTRQVRVPAVAAHDISSVSFLASAPIHGITNVNSADEVDCPTKKPVQRRALMPTALSRMPFIAFAHSSAVAASSNTNVNSADEVDCPTKKPGSSGAPSSREMLCTVLTIHAMFCSLYVLVSLLGFAALTNRCRQRPASQLQRPANSQHVLFGEDQPSLDAPFGLTRAPVPTRICSQFFSSAGTRVCGRRPSAI